MDIYYRLNSDRRLLRSEGSKDIDILITEDAQHIYILVAGIWSLAYPWDFGVWLDIVTWESLCVSYDSDDQALNIAFRNEIIFTTDEVFPNRKLTENFLKSLKLGEKDLKYEFVGDITRVNIWSKVLSNETMKGITNCGSSNNFTDIPDLLNWDFV